MTEKKEEPKYIGRYGEILKNVKEVFSFNSFALGEGGIYDVIHSFKFRDPTTPPDYFFLPLQELYDCSFSCDDKYALMYGIGKDKNGNKSQVLFQISRKTNKKHGDYFIITDDPSIFEAYGYRNDRLVAKTSKRNQLAKETKNLRTLFSDPTVQKAIKRGNLQEVKSVMTRALMKEIG